MFDDLRNKLAQVLTGTAAQAAPAGPDMRDQIGKQAPEATPQARPRSGKRMYHAAKASRLTAGWVTPNGSADAELMSSLTQLRARSRSLVRDASYAKRAKVVVMNNVIGTGIGMQAQVKNQRGKLLTVVNDAIEREWCEWSRATNCHTGGKLHFADLERQVIGQVFEAGEIFVRRHYSRFGDSEVPLGLELVEAERIAEDYQIQGSFQPLIRMGIEQDEFGRPLGIWVRRFHPNEIRSNVQAVDYFYRVPAEQMFHLYICDRWPQSRGEPWLHSAARRLNDMDGYSEAEIIAARGAASYMAAIESTNDNPLGEVEDDESNGEPTFDLEPGAVQHLAPGEKLNFVAPNRPNPNMDPFMRMMLREVAAGASVSYESISRDYSQSNFSSSRLALQEDRDLWRAIQQWFIRCFRCELHREWLRLAVMSRAIPEIDALEYHSNPEKFEAVAFRPRGWTYIDPVKDVAAAKEARRAGFTSSSQIIAEYGNGKDFDEVIAELKTENEKLTDAGVVIDTDPGVVLTKGEMVSTATDHADPSQEPAPPQPTTPARVINMRTLE